ncbi:MFS transporter [bacterium]|nr:MAG: MFS transporter [bacterium]
MNENGETKHAGRILAWGMYDFANTIYSMNVVSIYFPLLVVLNLGYPDIYAGGANSLSMLIVALSAPFLGQLTDSTGRRMPSLIAATIICCLFTAGIGFAAGGKLPILSVLAFFVVANVGFQLGLVFYNSLLPIVAPKGLIGRVSGIGVGLGYLGAIAGMILVMPFNEGAIFGIDIPWVHAGGRSATFLPTATLFLLFSLPTFIVIRERKPATRIEPRGRPLQRIIETLRDSKKYPGIRRFLVGKFLFQEGIETAIIFMAVYSEKAMGMPDSAKIPFFIVATLGAAIGSNVFGHLVDRIGPGKTLNIVLVGWIIALLLLLPITGRLPFFGLGIVIGALLGGVWTASRPLLLELSPIEAVGRYFGLYSLSGKAAAITGPLIWGAIVWVLKPLGDFIAYRSAVIVLIILIGAGWLVIRPLWSGTK